MGVDSSTPSEGERSIGPDGIREGEGGGGGGGLTMLQAPGTYTVKLTVGGREYTRPLRVVKDPHSAGTEADIAAQEQFLTSVRRDLDAAVAAVNNAELVRGQIRNLRNLTQDRELRKPIDDLDEKIIALEGQLLELRATGRGQDGVRFGAKLVQKITYLANGAQSADFKPTNQQLAVQKDLEAKLKLLQDQIDGVLTKDVAGTDEGDGAPRHRRAVDAAARRLSSNPRYLPVAESSCQTSPVRFARRTRM